MPELQITLLGGLRLRQPGCNEVSFASPKGALLLALLAYTPGKKYRREFIQDQLWPNSDLQHAQGNLRFALHQIRRLLGGDQQIVFSDSRLIWLDPAQCRSRCRALCEALALAGNSQALPRPRANCIRVRSPHTGGGGTSRPGVPELARAISRQRLREAAGRPPGSCSALGFGRRGDPGRARCPKRYIEIDPHCERMYAAFMRAAHHTGANAHSQRAIWPVSAPACARLPHN